MNQDPETAGGFCPEPASADDLPQILFRSRSLLAVRKPSGISVHPNSADRSGKRTLLECVREAEVSRSELSDPAPVHRLDRGTSGIVLFALSKNAAADLGAQFAAGTVHKDYQALVRGLFPDNLTVDRALSAGKMKKGSLRSGSDRSLPAVTEFTCLERFSVPVPSGRFPTTDCSLIEAQPQTGRFHQIRRHLNRANHPVLGDSSHGDSHRNRFFREKFGMTRLMLASTRLIFRCPDSGQEIIVQCPPDDSFTAVVEAVRPYQIRSADS